MKVFITYEWNEYTGIRLNEMYQLRESVELFFKERSYGTSITDMWIVITALDRDWKQRRRLIKKEKRFQYDILLDFFSIVDSIEDKKEIVCNQIIEITKETFSKYKFENFDKNGFLEDFEKVVNQTKW